MLIASKSKSFSEWIDYFFESVQKTFSEDGTMADKALLIGLGLLAAFIVFLILKLIAKIIKFAYDNTTKNEKTIFLIAEIVIIIGFFCIRAVLNLEKYADKATDLIHTLTLSYCGLAIGFCVLLLVRAIVRGGLGKFLFRVFGIILPSFNRREEKDYEKRSKNP